jgi:hypothetical protein
MDGMETQQAIRWLILLMVLTCDPATIALAVAASIGGEVRMQRLV